MLVLSAALACASAFLPACGQAAPPEFTAVVTKVSDGDTLTVDRGGKPIKVRLRFIDAPELAHSRRQTDQPYGTEAMRYVETWKGRTVTVTPQGRDRYGRLVAEVRKCEAGRCVDLGASLARNGLAWVDERYKPPKTLLTQQALAQKEKRGLWKDDAPVAPWDWRKKVRDERRVRP